MDVNYRYEAWRRLVIILAGLLIGYSISSFSSIRDAVLSLTDFDQAFPTTVWPSLLSILVIFYIAKNAHGLLITLFDDHYEEKLEKDLMLVICSWCLTTLLIGSFALVCKMSLLVKSGSTLESRCIQLIAFILFPNIILFLLDIFHLRAFEYAYRVSLLELLRRIIREILENPLHRDRHERYKYVWLLENFVSICIVVLWFVFLKTLDSPPLKIALTLWTLGILLLLNSAVDYVLNCRYFFFGQVSVVGRVSEA
ncbi:MAG: hypothetical protein P9F19_11300 [Candidatus Contendobacter sp.]|nr:hypothetical protein [Candidatus Contendobacter sp.]MDG4557955.1 hypothetical protein [Candidatus Contendobacter sp.]